MNITVKRGKNKKTKNKNKQIVWIVNVYKLKQCSKDFREQPRAGDKFDTAYRPRLSTPDVSLLVMLLPVLLVGILRCLVNLYQHMDLLCCLVNLHQHMDFLYCLVNLHQHMHFLYCLVNLYQHMDFLSWLVNLCQHMDFLCWLASGT